MSYGMRAWDAQGNLTFDSVTDLTLFPQTEQFISGNSQVGANGLTISYPQFQGKKIMAFMTSPYGEYYHEYNYTDPQNQTGPDAGTPIPAVLSCKVIYSGGTPSVMIFSDTNVDSLNGQTIPLYDGYLVVMLTGANQ